MDIYMSDMGLEEQWITILDDYLRPFQERAYLGYISVRSPRWRDKKNREQFYTGQ